jgi:hypothetical protein
MSYTYCQAKLLRLQAAIITQQASGKHYPQVKYTAISQTLWSQNPTLPDLFWPEAPDAEWDSGTKD